MIGISHFFDFSPNGFLGELFTQVSPHLWDTLALWHSLIYHNWICGVLCTLSTIYDSQVLGLFISVQYMATTNFRIFSGRFLRSNFSPFELHHSTSQLVPIFSFSLVDVLVVAIFVCYLCSFDFYRYVYTVYLCAIFL